MSYQITVFRLAILAQVLDGVLSYIGINRGHPEGNPLVAFLIAHAGLFGGLLIAKTYGALCFYMIRHHVKTLVVLTVFYYVVAVFPWIVFLTLGV